MPKPKHTDNEYRQTIVNRFKYNGELSKDVWIDENPMIAIDPKDSTGVWVQAKFWVRNEEIENTKENTDEFSRKDSTD